MAGKESTGAASDEETSGEQAGGGEGGEKHRGEAFSEGGREGGEDARDGAVVVPGSSISRAGSQRWWKVNSMPKLTIVLKDIFAIQFAGKGVCRRHWETKFYAFKSGGTEIFFTMAATSRAEGRRGRCSLTQQMDPCLRRSHIEAY